MARRRQRALSGILENMGTRTFWLARKRADEDVATIAASTMPDKLAWFRPPGPATIGQA